MSGGTVIAPNAPVVVTWAARAWEALADLLIVTALVWAPVLLLGAVAAIFRLLFQTP